MPINIAIPTLPGTNTIAKVAIAAKIVTTLVIINKVALLAKHIGTQFSFLNSAIDNNIIISNSIKRAIDKAIIIGIIIVGIVPKKNNIPIIIPNIAPIKTAIHPQLLAIHILALP